MSEYRLLVATSRPLVLAFYQSLRARMPAAYRLDHVPAALEAVEAARHLIAAASAVVVDMAGEDGAALLCQEIHSQRPALPILGYVCCPHLLQPEQIQTLAAAGASTLVDSCASAEEIAGALRQAHRGAATIHLRFGRSTSQRRALGELLDPDQTRQDPSTLTTLQSAGALHPTNVRLLQLLVQGCGDTEMARALHLQPDSVKHRLDRLRVRLGMKNRIELAAWAGQHGFRTTLAAAS